MNLQGINISNSNYYTKSVKEKFMVKDNEKLKKDVEKQNEIRKNNLDSNKFENEQEENEAVTSSKIVTTADGMKTLLLIKDLKVVSSLSLGKSTNDLEKIQESEVDNININISESNE